MARKYSGVPIRPDDIYDTEHVKPKRAPTPPPQLVQDIQPIPMPLDIHPKDSFDPKLEGRPPILDPGWGCMTDWGTPGPITSAICKRPNPEDIFKNPKGNVVKVNFGHKGKGGEKTMRIKKSNHERRKSFRARHNCDNPGPRHKARYWSCRKW